MPTRTLLTAAELAFIRQLYQAPPPPARHKKRRLARSPG